MDKYITRFLAADKGNEYEMLTPFINSKTKITVRHKKCEASYEVGFHKFLEGNRCPKCKNKGLSHQEFVLKYNHLFINYEILTEITTFSRKITFKHLDCNNIFQMSPNKFVTEGQRCPLCMRSNSKLEAKTEAFLIKNGILYKKEFSFYDLKGNGGNKLRFDFAILKPESLDSLIECDGIQHFVKTKMYYQESISKNDASKNNYCDAKGIKLLRIAYFEYDKIFEILVKHTGCHKIPDENEVDECSSRKMTFKLASEMRRSYAYASFSSR